MKNGKRNRQRFKEFDQFVRTVAIDVPQRKDGESLGPVDISVSSESDKVSRWFGREILSHEKNAVDLRRLRSHGAWLFNHDADRIIGPITNARVEDNVLRMELNFDDTEDGRTAAKRVESGSLKGASIRYVYGTGDFETVEEGQTKNFRGREIEGPARIVKRWMPVEATLTPIPADETVGVGRSQETSNMSAVWELVSKDGLRLIRGDGDGNPFKTKKDAQAFLSESEEDDLTIRKIEAARSPMSEPADPKPKDTSVDVDAIRKSYGAEGVSLALDLVADAEIADEREFVIERLRAEPGLNPVELRREMHKRWREKAKKEHQPVGTPSTPTGTDKRGLESLDDDSFVVNLTRATTSDLHIEDTGMLRATDYRALISNDKGNFQKRVSQLFGKGKDGADPVLRPEMISLKASHELLGDVPCRELKRDEHGHLRAITTTAFAVLTGQTVIAKIRDAYENVEMIGDRLTTQMNSSTPIDTIPGVLTEDSIKEVGEGQDYQEAGATEEYAQIGHRKQGGIIRVTRETIQFDQTGTLLVRLNRLGEDAANRVEKLTLQRIADSETGSAVYVYKPAGTGTALYSTTARARGTNKVATNGLVDATDLDNARAKLAAMTKHNGDPINVQPRIILIPDALIGTANKILGSEMTPGTENELNPWGPRGQWRPTILSSPFLDTFTNGTTTWYLGDPQKQFIRKWVFQIETSTKGADADASFTADVVFQAKVAFDCEVGAIDYTYFIQNAA